MQGWKQEPRTADLYLSALRTRAASTAIRFLSASNGGLVVKVFSLLNAIVTIL